MSFRAELIDFGAFYERTYHGAFRTALAIVRDPSLAADVTQEAFVSAFRRRDGFRGDAPVQAWLHQIVVRAALGAIRRRRTIVRELVLDQPGTTDESRASVDRIALFEALEVLPPRHRAAVVLRYYHDYDYQAIARILGTTSTNVGSILSRSLDRLRDALEPARPAETETGALTDG